MFLGNVYKGKLAFGYVVMFFVMFINLLCLSQIK